MKKKIEELLPLVTTEEQAELKILYNAVVTNANAYQTEPSAVNLKNWRDAKHALVVVMGDIQAKYQKDDVMTEELRPTKKPIEVHRWLTAGGWQIGQARFYQHIKEGKLTRAKDGLFNHSAVLRYAKAFLKRIDTGKTLGEDNSDLSRSKLSTEIDLKQVQLQREQLRLDIERGRYLPKGEVEAMLAGRAGILDADFEYMACTRAQEFITLVGGDLARTDQLITQLLAARDEWLNRYARPIEFDVEFAAGLQPMATEAETAA